MSKRGTTQVKGQGAGNGWTRDAWYNDDNGLGQTIPQKECKQLAYLAYLTSQLFITQVNGLGMTKGISGGLLPFALEDEEENDVDAEEEEEAGPFDGRSFFTKKPLMSVAGRHRHFRQNILEHCTHSRLSFGV